MENVYTCDQIADRYGVKRDTVWRWIRDRRLPVIKIGKRYVVRESSLQDFESAGDARSMKGGNHANR